MQPISQPCKLFRSLNILINIECIFKNCACEDEDKACSMVEEVVWEQWMFQPNACIQLENDKPNNQFESVVILNYRWR